MVRIVIAISLVFAAGQCRAEWTLMNPLPQPYSLYSVHGRSGHDLWAVGDHGTVMMWNGTEWSQRQDAPDQNLRAHWMFPDGQVFGCGANGYLCHWDGTQWRGHSETHTAEWQAMWGWGANSLVVTGESDHMMMWDGTVWSRHPVPESDLTHVWGNGPEDVYAIASAWLPYYHTARLYHWDGASWTALTSGTERWLLSSIWGAAGDVFYTGTFAGAVLRWQGTEWQDMACPLEQDIISGWCAADTLIYVLGREGGLARWNGSAWTILAPRTAKTLTAAFATADDLIMAVGHHGAIYRWDGDEWLECSQGTTNSLWGVWTYAADDAIACGLGGSLVRWNGTEWQDQGFPQSTSFYSLWGTGPDDVTATAGPGMIPLIYQWDGHQWRQLEAPAGLWEMLGLWGTGPDDLYIGTHDGQHGIVLHWDGHVWTRLLDDLRYPVQRVWGIEGGPLFAAAGNLIFRWDGTDWLDISPDTEGYHIHDIWGPSATELFAAIASGEKMLHWDGAAWEQQPTGITGAIMTVWRRASNDVFAANILGQVLHYDGQAWTELPRMVDIPIYESYGNDAGEVFFVGDYGLILRWSGAIPPELGVQIHMPSMVYPGDFFSVTGLLGNPGPPIAEAAVFFILDVFGEMWFWDDWTYYAPPASEQIDYRMMEIPAGSTPVDVVAAIPWPDTGPGTVTGLYFHGAMLTPDLRSPIGAIASVEWGYGSRE